LVQFAEEEPYFAADEDSPHWTRNGDRPSTLIAELTDCAATQIAQDVVERLGDAHAFDIHRDGDTDWYDEGSEVYVLGTPDNSRFRDFWSTFCESLKHKRPVFRRCYRHP